MRLGAVLKESSFYVFIGFLPMGVNFILSPLYTYYLEPAQYGIIGLADLFNGLISVFLALGIQQAFARLFFDYEHDKERLNNLLSTIMLLLLGVAFLLFVLLLAFGDSLLGYAFSSEVFLFSNYGYMVLLSAFSGVIQQLFASLYRNSESPKMYAAVSLGYFVCSVTGILIGVVYLENGALGNIAGRAIGMFGVTLLIFLLFFLKNGISFDKRYLKPILSYGLPLLPYSLILFLYNALDRFFVERFFDMETLGIYNFAFLVTSVISVFSYSIYNSISPKIFRLLRDGSSDTGFGMQQLVNFQILGSLGFISIIMAGVYPLITWFVQDEYSRAIPLVFLIAIAYIPQVFYIVYTAPIFYFKKTATLPFISSISLLLGVFSFLALIPLFGVQGACYGLILVKLIQLIVVVLFSKEMNLYASFNFRPYKAILLSGLTGISIFLVSKFTQLESGYSVLYLVLIGCVPVLVFTVGFRLIFHQIWDMFYSRLTQLIFAK